MIAEKTIVIAALAATPVAAVVAAPVFDWTLIVAALIGATPTTLLVYFEGRRNRKAVNGVVSKLLVKNTEAATAAAEAESAPKILKLTEEKATAEATIATTRAEQARQDKAAKGVVVIPSRRLKKPKAKGKT